MQISDTEKQRYIQAGYNYMICYRKFSTCFGEYVECRFPVVNDSVHTHIATLIDNGCTDVEAVALKQIL